jgi:protein-arginine kinase activator protein McsA
VSIFANDEVMEEAGISATQLKNEDDIPNDQGEETDFLGFDTDELEELLQEIVENEDFERATIIRDEIKRRKSNT